MVKQMKPSSHEKILISCAIILLVTGIIAGCGRLNPVLMETRVNDPIMMNLLDNDVDLAQIEDGTGFAGEATSCPT